MKKLNVHTIFISKQAEISEKYKEFLEIVDNNNISVKFVKLGDKIKFDKDIFFEILWPSEKLIAENALNNNAIVGKLSYNNFSCLFTGDIEEIAEKEITNMYEKTNKLNSTILKVAHHGSKSSSTQEFLNKVNPKVALIGVGQNNKFGHPNCEVIERLNKMKCTIYRTDEMGEITIRINEKRRIRINVKIEKDI